MKTFRILFFLVPLLFLCCQSQESIAKKELKKQQEELVAKKAALALENKNFVIEGRRLLHNRNNYMNISPNINFIKLENNKATIQLSSSSAQLYENGAGGITLDGNASDVKFEKSKNGDLLFGMNVKSATISAYVSIIMHEGSNYCTATVMPTYVDNKDIRVTLTGYLFAPEDANIFIGNAK